MKFTVLLDFSGCFEIEVDADSASEALEEARDCLILDDGNGGSVSPGSVSSFQVYDEKMQPCDVDD